MGTSGTAGDGRTVAIAACAAYPDLFEDWPLLRVALEEHGITARPVVWNDDEVDWSAFDLVVANSAWDNIHRPDEFLAWVDRVAALGVPVVNSPATLRWNIDKHYLVDLAEAGVPTVPTVWVEPDGALGRLDDLVLPDSEIVVKPAISGGGFQTARYPHGERSEVTVHIAALVASGRSAMIQPYQVSVDARGEIGLIFLGGTFSHAIHKAPMIRPGVGATDSLVANQVVVAATATAEQIRVARGAVAVAEELLGPTAYARVDVVERTDGIPAVLELELLDPVLFFETCPEGAARFGRALRDRLAG